MTDSYIEGFCKTAEAFGVDGRSLLKEADIFDGLGSTSRRIAALSANKARQYASKLMPAKARQAVPSASTPPAVPKMVGPLPTLSPDGSLNNYLKHIPAVDSNPTDADWTNAVTRYRTEMDPKWNKTQDLMVDMLRGAYPNGVPSHQQGPVNSKGLNAVWQLVWPNSGDADVKKHFMTPGQPNTYVPEFDAATRDKILDFSRQPGNEALMRTLYNGMTNRFENSYKGRPSYRGSLWR